MCGIAGYVLHGPLATGVTRLTGMLGALAHRGPDDEGLTLFDPASGARQDLVTAASARDAHGRDTVGGVAALPHSIALGHRRFSIIDLSGAAHQPFCSRDGRVWAAFNGEIYNYVEVRRELAGRGAVFATDSDTEVLVEAYREWGVECFRRFNGFWALTLYDAARGEVLLARDRIGKAPLYLTRTPEGLFWASEIKGLMAGLGRGAFAVDAQAVDDFVVHGWRDLFDETFYRGVATFPAASYAWVRPDGEWTPTRYWEVPRHRRTEREVPVGEAATRLRELLADAVRIRLRADVPVGLDLSGGMDSSSIVALATHQVRDAPLRVFTLSYPGSAFDELPWADLVFERYRGSLVRTVLEPTNEDFLSSLDRFVALMDEPFHDLALLGHQDIWRSMRDSGIRVSLNGAAGDEALAGYGSDYFEPYLRHLARSGRIGRCARGATRPWRSRRRSSRTARAPGSRSAPDPPATWRGCSWIT
jgi:asparagine synthase (glutamine-hydrolysing)